MDGRFPGHAVVPFPRRRQGDQERGAAHCSRVAGGAVRLSRRIRRYVWTRQALAHDRQHPGPHPDQVLEVRLQLAVQGRRLLSQRSPLHRQQVGNGESHHGAGRRFRHRPRARVRHLRLQDRRSQTVSEGSRRIRSELPPGRIRRHHAVPHHQRLQRCAGLGADSHSRRRVSIHRARRRVAAADQPGCLEQIRHPDRQLRGRKRFGAAGSGAGHRQALEHGCRRQPERLREVSDGEGHGDARRRRCGRDGN